MKKGDEKAVNLPSREHLAPRFVGIHYERPVFDRMAHIGASYHAQKFVRDSFPEINLVYKEYFWVLCLNRANRVISISLISMGTDTGTYVSSKEILQLAFLTHASAVIVVHNHPSGNLEPSKPDMWLTKNIAKALKYIDVELLDHIILTQESYYSMADEGLI